MLNQEAIQRIEQLRDEFVAKCDEEIARIKEDTFDFKKMVK